ncbi:MAG: DNA polymerase I [Oscillospiraceae bacterium]|nr:DNA polymerase I [Oscillospiraceae bacterium]
MKLMAIDGNSIINRAFYGVRPLTTQDGTPTNAVYGFLTILLKLLEEENPDALCVCFDMRAPTFRHQAYDGYKAKRKGMPDELAVQMPILKEVLSAMCVACYELEGWEADDLIGTVAAAATAGGWETVIVTGDKDSLQLIDDHVRVKLVSTRMGQTTTKEMTPETFRAEYGMEPLRMIDLKALMGDSSDNIPGVPGVGEKTAMELLHNYGDLPGVYANLDAPEMKAGVRKKLEEGRALADLSFDLATIHCDAPLGFTPADAQKREPDREKLLAVFRRLEFSKLIEKFDLHDAQGVPQGAHAAATVSDCALVTDAGALAACYPIWEKAEFVSVLTAPDWRAVAVFHGGEAVVILADRLGEAFTPFLARLFDGTIPVVTHGAKALLRALLDEGIVAGGIQFDTEIAAYLLAPTDGSYALEKLYLSYFNDEIPAAKAFTDPAAFEPLGDCTGAAQVLAAHAAAVAALYPVQRKSLTEMGMLKLLEEMELPLCPVLAEMERDGFLIDRKALEAFGVTLKARSDTLQQEIYDDAGCTFNINSTQQLGQILFEQMGLPPTKKTKTGYSTGADVLEKLRGLHPIIERIQEFRQLTKLNSTYVEGFRKLIGADNKLHTSFQNTVTATGRLSSTEPNLQNIPVRTELGAQMRHMFIAPEGYVLVDADYSQIELRLLAHIADDAAMIADFQNGADIHTTTAAQVFGVPRELVTAEMRRRAKAVNFGIVYGISDFSLSQDLHVTRGEAKAYMERYFAHYTGVRRYMDKIVAQSKRDGYVSTLFGRRRWIPELKSSNYNLRSFGERVALNMPIQGTAADIIKRAMICVWRRLRAEKLQSRLLLQVHDELIVLSPKGEAEMVQTLLTEEMEAVAKLSVPLTAEAHCGKSWAEAKA